MIETQVKKSLIFREFSNSYNDEYFNLSTRKFLHNIDSLYFSVKVKNDWDDDLGCQSLVKFLDDKKEETNKSFEKVNVSEFGDDFIMHGIGSTPYYYEVDRTDHYLIFFLKNKRVNTPELWVQIRSQLLWLEGEYRAVEKAIIDVETILSKFGIEILEIKENRIDFAYHTNYIQDPLNFFKEDKLNAMQISRFKRASKEFCMVGEWDVDCDYITFGRKKSNNIFLRIYNKTKEVIELGYKGFFNQIWLDNKLINKFDFYCLDKTLNNSNGNYKYLDISRLEFYIEFGSDKSYKSKADSLIKSKNIDYAAIKKLADILVPKVTLILNVEFETRRKFYRSLDDNVNDLLKCKTKCNDYSKKLYIKLDNKKLFTNLLTTDVIRFIDLDAKNNNGEPITRKKNYPTANWWKRLQTCKVNKHDYEDEKIKLIRTYQRDIDIEVTKKRLINSVSTYNLYVNTDLDSSIYDDVLDFVGSINESDTQKAIEYKKKKFSQLKNRLSEENKLGLQTRDYSLLNNDTGELI